MTESAWQKRVIALARRLGWTVRHVQQSTIQTRDGRRIPDRLAAGLPDLILIRDRVIWAELKSETGKLRPAQTELLARLNDAGAETYVWRPSDIDQVKQVLTAR